MNHVRYSWRYDRFDWKSLSMIIRKWSSIGNDDVTRRILWNTEWKSNEAHNATTMSQKIMIENYRYEWITWHSRSHARAIDNKSWSVMTARESWSKKWRMVEYQESAFIKYQYQRDEREKVHTISEVLSESLVFDTWDLYFCINQR